MELLAPAGSQNSLTAAVQSGADAVYLGGTRFSARANASNFTNDTLKQYIDYCHKRGVSVHIAANTLIKENETDDFLEYIGFLNDIGVDAVIIQDLGMASAVKKLYPDLPLHASTQLTCASLEGAKFLKNAGFSRVVLARELDLESIERICKNVDIETEIFIHGAICMSYSGQCLMSSMIGGRSGNRGHCAQPCRLPYNFTHNGKNVNKGYLLSPKDMCLVNHLFELDKIGVTSLKIEGRLKRAEYVSAVTGVYRNCLDHMKKASKDEYNELLDAFNRSGFTDGYFTKNIGAKMMAYDNPSNVSENRFSNDAIQRCRPDVEFKKIPIDIECSINIGKPVRLLVKDNQNNSVTVYSDALAEYAINKPTDKERVVAQLGKLGNTQYEAKSVFVEIEDNAVIPISQINDTRRKAIDELDKKRVSIKKRRKNDIKFDFLDNETLDFELSASCMTKEQAKACILAGIKRIYTLGENILELEKEGLRADFLQVLPPIDRENKNKHKYVSKKAIASSYAQIGRDDDVCYSGDFRLNITNSYSLDEFKDLECVTLSPELSINELKAIKKPCDTEVIAYGRIPLMTYENCPVKAQGMCDKGASSNALTDRMNETFPLLCTEGCFCVLLNSKPIYMADKIEDLKKTGAKFLRLDFTVESYKECERIVKEYKNALNNEKILPRKENTFTRGHYYKKID